VREAKKQNMFYHTLFDVRFLQEPLDVQCLSIRLPEPVMARQCGVVPDNPLHLGLSPSREQTQQHCRERYKHSMSVKSCTIPHLGHYFLSLKRFQVLLQPSLNENVHAKQYYVPPCMFCVTLVFCLVSGT